MNKLILIILLTNLFSQNNIQSEIGRYQMVSNANFRYIFDTTNGMVYNELKGIGSKRIVKYNKSTLDSMPIGTYQLSLEYDKNAVIPVPTLYVINTSNATIYKLKNGNWKVEKFKSNVILN